DESPSCASQPREARRLDRHPTGAHAPDRCTGTHTSDPYCEECDATRAHSPASPPHDDEFATAGLSQRVFVPCDSGASLARQVPLRSSKRSAASNRDCSRLRCSRTLCILRLYRAHWRLSFPPATLHAFHRLHKQTACEVHACVSDQGPGCEEQE